MGIVIELIGTFVDAPDITIYWRRRKYKQGKRVYVRARISGLPGSLLLDWLAAEDGKLWMVREKGKRTEQLRPIQMPSRVEDLQVLKGTWKEGRSMVYDINGHRVQIWSVELDLVCTALKDGIARQHDVTVGD